MYTAGLVNNGKTNFWHFRGAADIAVLYRTDGWSQQGTLLQKIIKMECEVISKISTASKVNILNLNWRIIADFRTYMIPRDISHLCQKIDYIYSLK